MTCPVKCVGCGKGIGNRNYQMDDNGEIGCPACFTEDGRGECWNREILSAGDPMRELARTTLKGTP